MLLLLFYWKTLEGDIVNLFYDYKLKKHVFVFFCSAKVYDCIKRVLEVQGLHLKLLDTGFRIRLGEVCIGTID